MAAFQEDRCAEFLRQSFCSTRHLSPVSNRGLEEEGCFIEIRRNKSRERKEVVLVSFNSFRFEEIVAARGNHYRIDHQRDGLRCFFFGLLNRVRDSANDLRRAEQTGLDRAYFEIFEEHFDLLANHSRSYWFNSRNFPRNFRDDAGHSGQSINAESGKSFEVGLNTGASATVRTSNGQGDGR